MQAHHCLILQQSSCLLLWAKHAGMNLRGCSVDIKILILLAKEAGAMEAELLLLFLKIHDAVFHLMRVFLHNRTSAYSCWYSFSVCKFYSVSQYQTTLWTLKQVFYLLTVADSEHIPGNTMLSQEWTNKNRGVAPLPVYLKGHWVVARDENTNCIHEGHFTPFHPTVAIYKMTVNWTSFQAIRWLETDSEVGRNAAPRAPFRCAAEPKHFCPELDQLNQLTLTHP